jgi:hypothetical protein
MAFHYATSPSSGSYREILTRLVAFSTSKHISAVAINAAGTSYTAGDILTITHAGAYGDAKIEVLTVGGSGQILTVAIRSAGAFSNRVATVALNAGGSSYPVSLTNTLILEIQGGTSTEKAKVSATTNGSGVVTAVALFETGGAYSVAPSATAATTAIVGPSTATTGSGCTINTTMTGLIGTTGISATGGTGSSATFDLTLTDTGWTAMRNENDYSVNSINNEKEIILRGTVSGGDEPYIGFRTYTQTSGLSTRYGWVLVGMDGFNAGLAFASQPNAGPLPGAGAVGDPANVNATGPYFLLFDNAQDYWFNVTGRRMICVVKAVGASITAYMSMYAGLMNPFGTATESPYPLYLSATTGVSNTAPDAATSSVTGITEQTAFANAARQSAAYFRDANQGLYVRVGNSTGSNPASLNATYDTAVTSGITSGRSCLYPVGSPHADTTSGNNAANIVTNGRLVFGNDDNTFARVGATLSEDELGPPSAVLYPTIGDNELLLVPCVVSLTDNGTPSSNHSIRGELDSVYWIPGTTSSGTSVASEDTVTISGTRYKIFANAHRTQRYCYFAIKEA